MASLQNYGHRPELSAVLGGKIGALIGDVWKIKESRSGRDFCYCPFESDLIENNLYKYRLWYSLGESSATR